MQLVSRVEAVGSPLLLSTHFDLFNNRGGDVFFRRLSAMGTSLVDTHNETIQPRLHVVKYLPLALTCWNRHPGFGFGCDRFRKLHLFYKLVCFFTPYLPYFNSPRLLLTEQTSRSLLMAAQFAHDFGLSFRHDFTASNCSMQDD